ncbi:MAG: TetR/AcrR family transcriptional regulator [Aureispira sp.]
MSVKADRTKQFILEKVAPIFNQYGYMGASMAVITKEVGMTKGAIYGNFENKEALAIAAFNYNVRLEMNRLKQFIEAQSSPVEQLFAILDFYAYYRSHKQPGGGCPIINIGVDANNQQERLLQRVQEVIGKLEQSMEQIIKAGIERKQLREDLNITRSAKHFYTSIQGAVFMAMTLKDDTYLQQMSAHLRQVIEEQWRI